MQTPERNHSAAGSGPASGGTIAGAEPRPPKSYFTVGLAAALLLLLGLNLLGYVSIKAFLILLEVILLFNLIIIVHEYGHFLAARWRGLVVERFGIWFGNSLWKKEINGVIYSLGCIPAGGYVALPQMAPMEAIEGKSDRAIEDLPPVTAWDKIIVAFAGPLFSFGLALAFAALVWWVGRPVSESETTTVIGYVEKDSPAEKIGLRPGDQVVEVDGYPVSHFLGVGESISWRIVRSEGEKIKIKVNRDGQILEFFPTPVKEPAKGWERSGLRQIMIRPRQTPIVAKVAPHSPAQRAGLKANDVIVAANGQKLYRPEGLAEFIEKNPKQPITITVKRGQQTLDLTVTPELPVGDKRPRVGIYWDLTGRMTLTHPNPIEQIQASVNSMVSTLSALFSPKSDIKAQHLSGPVGIMRMYYLLFESEQGWRLAIWFSVVLNVNLALLNLLPIPVLDGGHITLALAEAIRRKPINVRVLQYVQTGCAVLIIGYMLYITFYDVQDLPWKKARPKPDTEMKFVPPRESAPAK